MCCDLVLLLRQLRDFIQTFAAQSADLARESQERRTAAARVAAFAGQQETDKLNKRLAEAGGELEREREAARLRLESRQDRIQQAYKTRRKSLVQRIEEREGRLKYQLQKRALDANRQREADLASAATRLKDFQTRSAAMQDRFAKTEWEVHSTFGCVTEFCRELAAPRATSAPSRNDEEQMLVEAGRLLDQVGQQLKRFRRHLLLTPFRFIPLWLLLLGCALTFVVLSFVPLPWTQGLASRDVGAICGGAALLLLFGYWMSKRFARPLAHSLIVHLAEAHLLLDSAPKQAERHLREDQQKIERELEELTRRLDGQWQEAQREAEQAKVKEPKGLDERLARALARSEALHRRFAEGFESAHARQVKDWQAASEQAQAAIAQGRETKLAEAEGELSGRREALRSEWATRTAAFSDQLRALAALDQRFPPWREWSPDEWVASSAFPESVPFGRLEVDLKELAESAWPSEVTFPGPTTFSAPMLLRFPDEGSLLVESNGRHLEAAHRAMNSVIYRLLASSPPGKIEFTILDPAGLGENFAALMHLADYEENHINRRIWTEPGQIEERLSELSQHIEKVIQMYLRNEYETIAEYNAQAGEAAEKLRFLVVAGFPAGFNESAARRLLNIAAAGPRCGVHLLISWDQRLALPHEFVPDDLRRNCVRVVETPEGFALPDAGLKGTTLRLDPAPAGACATELLRKVGESAKDANQVRLPFAQVAPAEAERWTADASGELRVPIGRTGATKLQYLALGRATRQHALIAGKTGSGKSNLLHVIITNSALWHNPDEVEFYLVDFKKGVEFKSYATWRLPHARVVAIESDREFALSVLQRVDQEMRRRGDLLRNAGVQDLPGYRRSPGAEALPRVLLVIDEFQEFFTEEDRVSQGAALLLDRLVRQGRAFGIHVVLGSQTLGGAYTLARATVNQMAVRIALQCNEADAYMIMDETNAAPRLLSRPGEALYNDMGGVVEGNSPFQVVWLPEDVRDASLAEVRALASRRPNPPPGPLVFEGNAPAEIDENPLLGEALQSRPAAPPVAPRIWLGAPNSIKGPAEVAFHKQSGNHLLIVGQAEEAAQALLATALIALDAQFPPNTARFLLLDGTAPGSVERAFLDKVVAVISRPVERPSRPQLGEVLTRLAKEAEARSGEEPPDQAAVTFVVIAGLHEFRQLRQEDDFLQGAAEGPSAAACLMTILSEGSTRGIHVIATIDTYSNVNRSLGRRGLGEFQHRVLFQMSQNDSASLIDSPEASQLGLRRALLYNEREGSLEKFRPYAIPGSEWLAMVAGFRGHGGP